MPLSPRQCSRSAALGANHSAHPPHERMSQKTAIQNTPYWATPKGVLVIVLVYMAAHFVLRMLMWPSLGVDDAEQALFTQHFQWSYRYRAPPLFTWLLIPIERLTGGPGILSITILRYVLLSVLALFVYLAARRLIADPRLAALALYSFAAVYVFGYYSHHDLTHTTAMSTMLAAAWYCLVRLVETPVPRWYAAFGFACGLGLISKWNFAILIGALLLAGLVLSDLRRRVLLRPGMLVALATMAVAAGPAAVSTVYWGPNNQDDLGAVLGLQASGGIDFALHLQAVAEVLGSIAIYAQPFLVIAFIAYWPNIEWGRLALWNAERRQQAGPAMTMAVTTTLAGALIFIAMAAFTGSLRLPERLMQPALFMLPVLFYLLVDGRETENRRLNGFTVILLVVTLIAFGGRIGVFVNEMRDCRHCRANQPYEELAGLIRADGFSGTGTVLVYDDHLAGNMRVVFPDARIVYIRFPLRYWPGPGQQRDDCTIVRLEAEERSAFGADGDEVDRFGRFIVEKLNGAPRQADASGAAELGLLGSKSQMRGYAWEVFEGGIGDCS